MLHFLVAYGNDFQTNSVRRKRELGTERLDAIKLHHFRLATANLRNRFSNHILFPAQPPPNSLPISLLDILLPLSIFETPNSPPPLSVSTARPMSIVPGSLRTPDRSSIEMMLESVDATCRWPGAALYDHDGRAGDSRCDWGWKRPRVDTTEVVDLESVGVASGAPSFAPSTLLPVVNALTTSPNLATPINTLTLRPLSYPTDTPNLSNPAHLPSCSLRERLVDVHTLGDRPVQRNNTIVFRLPSRNIGRWADFDGAIPHRNRAPQRLRVIVHRLSEHPKTTDVVDRIADILRESRDKFAFEARRQPCPFAVVASWRLDPQISTVRKFRSPSASLSRGNWCVAGKVNSQRASMSATVTGTPRSLHTRAKIVAEVAERHGTDPKTLRVLVMHII
ncbi:hypothetical protein BDV93DRAFT_509538 [Ceratobasidium sp. AG-I]|nr:hypothetical protein BDV93DRAFT_509538 [Ceratobasidium sp. AG-I]